MKKILILTAGFGEGEDVAARNVRDAIAHLVPGETRVEMLDLFDSPYGRFRDLLQHALQAAIPRAPGLWRGFSQLLGSTPTAQGPMDGLARLRDVLRGMGADVVVSTSPVYNFLIEEIYRDGRTRDFTLIALLTDVAIGDSPWLRAPADFFAVTNESTLRELAAAGVAAEKMEVFGFPVQWRPAGADAGREKEMTRPDLAGRGRPRILYALKGAPKKAAKLLDRLLEYPEWDVTVCVGRDTALDEMARTKAAAAPKRMEVIGHTRRLPQLLATHHLVIGRAETGLVREAIAARCPMIVHRMGSDQEAGNLSMLRGANAGVLAKKTREVVEWLERAFRDEARLLSLWQKNLEPLGRPDATPRLARFILQQASVVALPALPLRALPAPEIEPAEKLPARRSARLRHLPKKLLLCDLHTHTTWSDGKLSVPEIVDFYGQRGFDCLCITDHLCDPKRLLGKLVNLTGLVIPPGEVEAYFEEIEREKKRAWARYDLLLMTGIEFNKDGYTPKTSTHLLGVDLKQPIDPSLDIKGLVAEIHAQGGLTVASHPHETKSHWGKDTLYLWEHVDEYAPLIDAWEVANRDDIFNPVGLKKLPFIANSDFHKPKHIHSWKTVLYCEKEAEAIKHCIRVNRDVSLTLYRDHRFGLDDERRLDVPALPDASKVVEFDALRLTSHRG